MAPGTIRHITETNTQPSKTPHYHYDPARLEDQEYQSIQLICESCFWGGGGAGVMDLGEWDLGLRL